MEHNRARPPKSVRFQAPWFCGKILLSLAYPSPYLAGARCCTRFKNFFAMQGRIFTLGVHRNSLFESLERRQYFAFSFSDPVRFAVPTKSLTAPHVADFNGDGK